MGPAAFLPVGPTPFFGYAVSVAYVTSAEIQRAAGGEKILLQLTDYDQDSREDASLITEIIREAETIVNLRIRRVRDASTPCAAVRSHWDGPMRASSSSTAI